MTMKTSPLTGNTASLLFSQRVLGKYNAEYYLDEGAQYIFVAAPSWLEEAYSDALAITDTGALERNIRNADRVAEILVANDLANCNGIDIGGGYGLFVRAIRDRGMNFFWSDKYADNLLARGFEAGEQAYEIAVAFEVLEHLENPLGFLNDAHTQYGFHTCIFSATCFTEGRVPDLDWWYWAFETGQHISFFSRTALDQMASSLGMTLYHLGDDIFAFSKKDLQTVYRSLPERLAAKILKKKRLHSLTMSDHYEMRDRLRHQSNATSKD